MPAIQLERLRNDILELDVYIKKLEIRGSLDRVKKLYEKKNFLKERLAAVI